MGLGVPDPKGIFGTTIGLEEKFGKDRVFDIPLSENALTGVALGAAITGLRPILTHQRVDFALVSMEQIINQLAKWKFMFGDQTSAYCSYSDDNWQRLVKDHNILKVYRLFLLIYPD